jgi:hypothetical protein
MYPSRTVQVSFNAIPRIGQPTRRGGRYIDRPTHSSVHGRLSRQLCLSPVELTLLRESLDRGLRHIVPSIPPIPIRITGTKAEGATHGGQVMPCLLPVLTITLLFSCLAIYGANACATLSIPWKLVLSTASQFSWSSGSGVVRENAGHGFEIPALFINMCTYTTLISTVTSVQ